MKLIATVTIAIALCTASCAADWNSPKQLETPVDGYPCGTGGEVCVGADSKPTGMCCWEGSVCGGPPPNVGCAAGECCMADYGAAPDCDPALPEPCKPRTPHVRVVGAQWASK